MGVSFQLYVIRHAQSANNALPESQRVEDPGITEIGHQQVERLAQRFEKIPITNTLTSAFLRAIQTMGPLAAAVRAQPEIWTDLHEVGGCFAGHIPGEIEGRPGMNRATLQKRFPEFQLPEDIDEHGWWKSKSYEDYRIAQERARAQAARLMKEFSGTEAQVACVIHADFKDLLLRELLPNDYQLSSVDLRNTGVTHLRCSETEIELVSLNDVSHLSPELITS